MNIRLKFWLTRIIPLIIVLVLIAWAVFLAWHAYGAWNSLKMVKALVSDVDGNSLPFEEAGQATHQALQHMQSLRAGMSPILPFLNLLGGLPGQAQPLLDYACQGLTAGDLAIQAGQPMLAELQKGEGPVGPRAIQAIQSNQQQFAEIELALQQAAESRQKIQPESLPAKLNEYMQLGDRFFPLANSAIKIAKVLPEIAGANDEKVYLIAAQNQDELRATGGFLSGAGLVRVKNGDIGDLSLDDSYMIDNPSIKYPAPPAPLKDYMAAGMWVFRDANWSPDFPTSARKMEELYELSVGEGVDGVIVFDQAALVMILQAMGPVKVDGVQEAISADNVLTWMHESWAPGEGNKLDEAWWVQRKSFMGVLAKSLMERLYSTRDIAQVKDLAFQTLEAIRQGHILFYFNEPVLQEALVEYGLDGGIYPETGDYLFLVDSNIGFNKSDARIKRALQYEINLSNPQAPTAALTAFYTHTAKNSNPCKHVPTYKETYQAMMDFCYWNYWRVLTAPGAKFINSDTRPVASEFLLTGTGWDGSVSQAVGESNTTEFSGLMLVPANTNQQWKVTWQTSPNVLKPENGKTRYDLKLQKQPGVISIAVRIMVTAPAGTTLQAPPPGWKQSDQPGIWVWEGIIKETKQFTLLFQ